MRWLTTALLLLATGCTSQPQTPVSEKPSQSVRPTATSTVAQAQNELPQVLSVGDGDTIRIKQRGKTITVRLGCIDAPESTQAPWGQQSANRLKQLLPVGQAVQVRSIERDRYGRTVAELYLANQSVNLRMVEEGQAVVYTQYLSGCSETKDQYEAAQAQAKAQKLGFWNQPNPVMPWDYRKGERSNNQPSKGASPRPKPKPSTAASPTPTTSTANLPACTKSDCDCKDFKTQAEAKRVLDAFPGDPFDLDRDKDGVPCESLP